MERPVTRLATKLITAKTKNTNNNVRPISIEKPAKPVAPSNIATSASTKNAKAALNISVLLTKNSSPAVIAEVSVIMNSKVNAQRKQALMGANEILISQSGANFLNSVVIRNVVDILDSAMTPVG